VLTGTIPSIMPATGAALAAEDSDAENATQHVTSRDDERMMAYEYMINECDDLKEGPKGYEKEIDGALFRGTSLEREEYSVRGRSAWRMRRYNEELL
jgi:hypothetical protein